MWRRAFLAVGASAALLAAAYAAEPPSQPKTAASRIVGVTVYQNSALVTREVEVPQGTGPMELVVNPLPPQTIDSSLYSEGTDGIRVLTTRYRMRPIQEDTREDVRKKEAQLKQLQLEAQKIQSDMEVIKKDLEMLAKLENFTTANLQHQTEKGTLNSEAIMALAKYVMEHRAEKAKSQVDLQDQLRTNQEQAQFVQRQLQELAAGSSRTERDAVIVVDKQHAPAGKLRLNYLVNAASWKPQYKFRASKANDKPLQVEYLAAVTQQTGEDWGNVKLILSTAEPLLNSAPPDLKMLEVAVLPRGTAPAGVAGQPQGEALKQEAFKLRRQAQKDYNEKPRGKGGNADDEAVATFNRAAALEQSWELLGLQETDVRRRVVTASNREGPSITYHLSSQLTIPSRQDEQVIEVAKIEMKPEYYYKAVPVLTSHVYRLADLTNKSEYVLLPGEATMYIGADFVGRAELPLVAIGEQFTAGFGVDPQLQVQRQMIDKTRAMQGDNQVLKFEYRILVSSYKAEPVKVQVWDRLPHADAEAVAVTLVKSTPEVCADPLYQRESRPHNLLRWDLTVEPGMTNEKALAVNYEFKLELGRQMAIGNFLTK
jgi:hypothetical protein